MTQSIQQTLGRRRVLLRFLDGDQLYLLPSRTPGLGLDIYSWAGGDGAVVSAFVVDHLVARGEALVQPALPGQTRRAVVLTYAGNLAAEGEGAMANGK